MPIITHPACASFSAINAFSLGLRLAKAGLPSRNSHTKVLEAIFERIRYAIELAEKFSTGTMGVGCGSFSKEVWVGDLEGG